MVEQAETLYSLADRVMRRHVKIYLELARRTKGLTNLEPAHLPDLEQKVIVLGGIGSPLDPASLSPGQVVDEWLRMQAVPFEIELGVTKGVPSAD